MSDVLAKTWYRMAEVSTDKRMRRVYLRKVYERGPELLEVGVSERVLAQIPTMLSERNYPLLDEYVGWLVQRQGWRVSFRHIRTLSCESPVMRGKTRDAVLHMLGLNTVIGMDMDPLKQFANMKGNSLEELRTKALRSAMRKLQDQIEKRNTFFLDIDALTDTTFVSLVPDILDARREEVMKLTSQPSLRDILSTYYGFLVFSQAPPGESGRSRGKYAITKAKRAFKRVAKSMGKRLTAKGNLLSLRGSIWENTSPELHGLLMNTIRLCTGREPERAAKELGQSGDSRVLDTLEEIHRRGSLRRAVKESVCNAILEIGRPCSEVDATDRWIAEIWKLRQEESVRTVTE